MMAILRCRFYLNLLSAWRSITRSYWRRTLIHSIVEIVVLLALHALLIRVMAAGNLASIIFTGGGQSPLWVQMVVGLFIGVRLLVTLGLPGMLMARAGLVWLAYRQDCR